MKTNVTTLSTLKHLKIFPILNLLVSIPFFIFLFLEIINFLETLNLHLAQPIPFYIYILAHVFFTGLTAFVNFYIFLKGVFSKEKQNYFDNPICTLLLSIWFIFFFASITLLDSSTPLYPPLSQFGLLALMLLILIVSKRSILSSIFIALLAISNLIFTSYLTIEAFREAYCMNVSRIVNDSRVEPTAEEKKAGYSWLYLSFRNERNCLKNFNLFSAIFDELKLK